MRTAGPESGTPPAAPARGRWPHHPARCGAARRAAGPGRSAGWQAYCPCPACTPAGAAAGAARPPQDGQLAAQPGGASPAPSASPRPARRLSVWGGPRTPQWPRRRWAVCGVRHAPGGRGGRTARTAGAQRQSLPQPAVHGASHASSQAAACLRNTQRGRCSRALHKGQLLRVPAAATRE